MNDSTRIELAEREILRLRTLLYRLQTVNSMTEDYAESGRLAEFIFEGEEGVEPLYDFRNFLHQEILGPQE